MVDDASVTVVAQALTADTFAPFGHVVSAGVLAGASSGIAANQGTAVRFDRCAKVGGNRSAAAANLAVFRSTAKSLPFTVRLLERHPCSTQTFLPMVCVRFLVVVAPTLADGTPDLSGLQAFVCGPGEGISYHQDVWHHPIIALDGDADFAMLAWEDGSALDCVEFPLSSPIQITI